jgi:hypothetical protein
MRDHLLQLCDDRDTLFIGLNVSCARALAVVPVLADRRCPQITGREGVGNTVEFLRD